MTDPLIIVQARLGSKRLPGKVLMPIKGRPMLAYLLERLPDEAVVATPDEEIVKLTRTEGKRAFWWAGPEDDVAGRFADCLQWYGNPSTFIRLCADSPLMDYALIEAAMALYEGTYFAISSPVGSVQVVRSRWWADWAKHREHVVKPDIEPDITLADGSRRLVVDTQMDFDFVEAVVEQMTEPHWSYNWRQICSLL